jgi:hypothetical protein
MFLDLFVRLFVCTKLSVEIRDSAYSETAINHNFRLKSNPRLTEHNFFPWHNFSSRYLCNLCMYFYNLCVVEFSQQSPYYYFSTNISRNGCSSEEGDIEARQQQRAIGDVRRGLCAHKPRVGVMRRLLVAHRWKGYRQRTALRATRHAHLVGCAGIRSRPLGRVGEGGGQRKKNKGKKKP